MYPYTFVFSKTDCMVTSPLAAIIFLWNLGILTAFLFLMMWEDRNALNAETIGKSTAS